MTRMKPFSLAWWADAITDPETGGAASTRIVGIVSIFAAIAFAFRHAELPNTWRIVGALAVSCGVALLLRTQPSDGLRWRQKFNDEPVDEIVDEPSDIPPDGGQ